MLDQLVARGDAAGPALALVVEAELVRRGRVDAAEPDAGVADQDLIAFADFRDAGDVGRLRAAAGSSSSKTAQSNVSNFIGNPGAMKCVSKRADCADNAAGLPVLSGRITFNFPSLRVPTFERGQWRHCASQSRRNALSTHAIASALTRARIITRRASASPISTKADVTSGPPTRIRVGVFILFHS